MSYQAARNALIQIAASDKFHAILDPHTDYEKDRMMFVAAALAENIIAPKRARGAFAAHMRLLLAMVAPLPEAYKPDIEKLTHLLLDSLSETQTLALSAFNAIQRAMAEDLGISEQREAEWSRWKVELVSLGLVFPPSGLRGTVGIGGDV